MIGKAIKSNLMSLCVLGTLGNAALAADTTREVDVFGNQSYCTFHREQLLEAGSIMSLSQEGIEAMETRFADTYVEGLRSGALTRKSVASMVVPLAGPEQNVVVHSPAAGVLAVSGNLEASMGMLVLDGTLHRGVQLNLVGDGHVTIDESVSKAGLEELYVFSHGTGAVTIDLRATAPCVLVDGGREHAKGPLLLDTSKAVPDSDFDVQCVQNIYGTTGNDTLHGNACNDNIYGRAGNDTVFGYSGRDFIQGEGGSDTLHGNEGRDCLSPGSFYDSFNNLYGGKDDDMLFGWFGVEACWGDDGTDICDSLCDSRNACEKTGQTITCYAN
jgi:hypothetical protein